jgi:hypothetical protein
MSGFILNLLMLITGVHNPQAPQFLIGVLRRKQVLNVRSLLRVSEKISLDSPYYGLKTLNGSILMLLLCFHEN